MKREDEFENEITEEKGLSPIGEEENRVPAFENPSRDEFTSYERKEEVRYEDIFDKSKPKTLGWSVASMVLGILSLVCCCLPFGGLAFSVAAVVLSVVARKTLGYFDGMAIAGLILGIFGLVMGVTVIVFTYGPFAEMYREVLSEMEKDSLSQL